MPGNYPATLPDYATNKAVNTVTDIAEAHWNYWYAEILAIATELGTDVAGAATDLKTRLAASLHIHDYQLRTVTSGDVTNGWIDFITKTYHPGDNSLDVFLNGQRLTIAVDYTETSTSRVTFLNDILTEGDTVVFKWWKSG